jgi:arsenate reductase (thioredoxin)
VHRVQKSNQRVVLRAVGGQAEDRPMVLFVCVHNAGRSRMAEAFLDQMAGDRYKAVSAGTEPAKRPHPEVVASMAEIGLEIGDHPGTLLTQEMTDEATKVISMGCNVAEACPALTTPMEDWELDDPKGQSPEDVAFIRDLIEVRVRNLIAKLDREHTPA